MLKTLVVALSFWLLLPSLVFASGFQLKSIGAMDVTGAVSTEWWYTSVNPVLAGVAGAGSTVTVSIDGAESTATADGEGNWAVSTANLGDGDHSITLSSPEGSQSFILHIGATLPADLSAPATTDLPVAGSMDTTAALWLGGMLLILSGGIFYPVKKESPI